VEDLLFDSGSTNVNFGKSSVIAEDIVGNWFASCRKLIHVLRLEV
jgi:hypothetical protein